MPDDDAGGDTHIHRMLGAKLRNLQATITGIHHLLLHTLHFITKYDGIFLREDWMKVLQHGASLALFHSQ